MCAEALGFIQMQGRRTERSRAWLITIQAPKEVKDTAWRAVWPEELAEDMTYKAQSYEKGEDAESIHTHILVNFKKLKTSNRLAKILIENNRKCEIDVQAKKGKWSEAREYVLKQDSTKIYGRIPVEWGNIPRDYTKKEERKEEIEKLVENIREGG